LKHLTLPVHPANQTSYRKKYGNFFQNLWVRHRKHSVKNVDRAIAIDSQVAELSVILIVTTEEAAPPQTAAPCARHGLQTCTRHFVTRGNYNENHPPNKKHPHPEDAGVYSFIMLRFSHKD